MSKKNMILAIDTVTPVMSVSLHQQGSTTAECIVQQQKTHSDKLIPVISWLIKQHGQDLKPDLIAVDIGPGSFTGIRIGIAAARALAHSWHLPVIGITSLDVLAEAAAAWNGVICCMIDALRDEVFEACFAKTTHPVRKSGYRLTSVECLIDDLVKKKEQVLFIGSGALLHEKMIRKHMKGKAFFASKEICFPRASCAGYLAERHFDPKKKYPYEKVNPFYVRKPAAEERRRPA